MKVDSKLRVLIWHVHGSYLYYLTQTDCLFYLPVTKPTKSGYLGKTKNFPWGENVKEIPAEDVKHLALDCIIFQSNFSLKHPTHNFLEEQLVVLSKEQFYHVPKIFLEHDPPRRHPTDTKHILYNSFIPLVHVTPFNHLMWDSGNTPTLVINHGAVPVPSNKYTGEYEKGLVVVNNLKNRGRRLGFDIFEKVRKEIPLDLVGIGSESIGGLGEIPPEKLQRLMSHYRFFFHPARYSSLGLAVIEAMMTGLPIVGFATTELPTVIQNGRNGYIDTDLSKLVDRMKRLLASKLLAKKLGQRAQKTAQKRFAIKRFTTEWKSLIERVVHENNARVPSWNSMETTSARFLFSHNLGNNPLQRAHIQDSSSFKRFFVVDWQQI